MAGNEPDRRAWLKIKCLNREEFVVVGWSDPEGSRHRLGSLLLGYYTPEGRLIYAGRAGTGLPEAELERLWKRLRPLATEKMPLAEPPPRGTRFGSPLVLRVCIGSNPKWLSRSAMSNGRLAVCSGTWFTWASAKISRLPRCAVADLMLVSAGPGKVGPPRSS
jgi:ATP dependent DNA ligase C terminal region